MSAEPSTALDVTQPLGRNTSWWSKLPILADGLIQGQLKEKGVRCPGPEHCQWGPRLPAATHP